MVRIGVFCLELRGLEPLTPCLQIAVIDRPAVAELGLGLAVSDRRVPFAPGANGTVMARRGGGRSAGAAGHAGRAVSRPAHRRIRRMPLGGGRVLRSGDRPGIEQELWALLTLYQLLRMAMTCAAGTRPGTDPDRASFTTALEAARDQLTAAAGIYPSGPAGLPGIIGQAVLATLLPPRRPRYSVRKVKCDTSRYLNRDDRRPRSVTTITAISVTVHTPRPDPSQRQRYRRPAPRPGPQPPTRRDLITGIILSQPPRDWTGHELAILLGVPPRIMLTQLGTWARLGFFTRTGFGTYRLNTPPVSKSPRDAPGP